MRYTLMIPGPVEVPDEILSAYWEHPVAHYGPDWTKRYLDTSDRMSDILGCRGKSFLMPGSGSLGNDAAAAAFSSGRKCLVIDNGMFGQRLCDIVSRYTRDVEILRFPLGSPADPDAIRKAVKKTGARSVFMTHVETSTGVINPVQEVGQALKDTETLFLLDAVSSAGIEPLEMDSWGIQVAVTASQKGLECPAGLGIVTVSEELLPLLDHMRGHSWYADLGLWWEFYKKWHDWHPFPVTLPTNTVLALALSLKILGSEGVQARQRFYRDISRSFRASIGHLGLKPFAAEGENAHGLTAISTGGKLNPSSLIEYLKERFHIQITGSFGQVQDHVFRVGHMSRRQCDPANLITLVTGIALFMKNQGLPVSLQDALDELVK